MLGDGRLESIPAESPNDVNETRDRTVLVSPRGHFSSPIQAVAAQRFSYITIHTVNNPRMKQVDANKKINK